MAFYDPDSPTSKRNIEVHHTCDDEDLNASNNNKMKPVMQQPTQEDGFNGNTGVNESNTTAWLPSRPIDPLPSCFPRTSEQCLSFIIYSKTDCKYGKMRNICMKLSNILKAYGHGEFLGHAREDSITRAEGVWSTYYGIALLSFDTRDEAYRCIQANSELRDIQWFGGLELYLINLCTPTRNFQDYRWLEIDLYDIKQNPNFNNYTSVLNNAAKNYGGTLIAGCGNIEVLRGTHAPSFMLLIQWRTQEDFTNFDKYASEQIKEYRAACCTRIICEILPGNSNT